MENTEIQTQDIDNMVDEVSNVLRTHLINIIKNIKTALIMLLPLGIKKKKKD